MIILSEVIIWKSLHLVFMIISSERGHSSSPLIEFLSILDKILDLLEYQEPFDKFRLPYQTPYPTVCVWTKENVHTPLSQLKMTKGETQLNLRPNFVPQVWEKYHTDHSFDFLNVKKRVINLCFLIKAHMLLYVYEIKAKFT